MAFLSNEEWLSALHTADNQQALEDLRLRLARALHYALAGRAPDGLLESLEEDVAQEAVLKILASLDSFRGESQFMTWATKIAVRLAFTELRRKRWQDVSLEGLLKVEENQDYTPAILADKSPTPEQQAEQTMMMETVQKMILESLSDRQRQAILAVLEGGMAMDEVARRLGTNRNALYKLLHDARLRLQKRLAAEGLSLQELLALFSEK
ncbi:MAG: sigma-70 family RNA polymerase sigma factor [Anaerolineaceae bacterium]|jgi:RNA polymerase sigma-70 factor (ECF subfamily)